MTQKFRVARIYMCELRGKPYYNYRVLAPWGAYIGQQYNDKLEAMEWIKNNLGRRL